MSGQGASGPNLSLIALVIVGAVFLIGFYYADRTSSSDSQEMAAANGASMQQPESAAMQAKIEKHKQTMADDTASGFSGSLEAYLTHAEQVQGAKELSSKGFSGSGSEYLGSGAKVGKTVEQINGVTATGQSMDDYLASAKPGSSKPAGTAKSSGASSNSPKKAAQEPSGSNEAFSGSMDEYMKKYGG